MVRRARRARARRSPPYRHRCRSWKWRRRTVSRQSKSNLVSDPRRSSANPHYCGYSRAGVCNVGAYTPRRHGQWVESAGSMLTVLGRRWGRIIPSGRGRDAGVSRRRAGPAPDAVVRTRRARLTQRPRRAASMRRVGGRWCLTSSRAEAYRALDIDPVVPLIRWPNPPPARARAIIPT